MCFERILGFFLLSLACTMIMIAGEGYAASINVVKIGVLAPLSGRSSAEGEEMVRGVQMAVDEINRSGGVKGNTLQVVTGDTKDLSRAAVSDAFKKITRDELVTCMMTGYASENNFEIELMAEDEMPYLLSANSTQTMQIIGQDPAKFPTVWSPIPSHEGYKRELPRVVELWAKAGRVTLKSKKVAVVTSENPYSMNIAEGLKDSFLRSGWTVAVDESVPFQTVRDWRAIIEKIWRNSPDLVVNTDYQPENEANFLEQLLEYPIKALVFFQHGPTFPEFMGLTRDKSTGVIYDSLGGYIPSSPIAMEVAKKFKAKYGVDPGPYGHMLYWQVHIYADALEKVGDPFDKLQIGKALGQTDKEISSGRLKFDPKTHLAVQGDDFIPILFFQIWEGKRNLVFPPKYATEEFQLPPWMEK